MGEHQALPEKMLTKEQSSIYLVSVHVLSKIPYPLKYLNYPFRSH